MPEPGTVLFLDAHGDLRASYEGSKYSQACPVFRLLEQGHQVVMAGIRSVYEAEIDLVAREPRLTLFMDRELRGQEAWLAFLDRVRSLRGPLYLSIDMDVFCPSLVPGVGTPQPDGFSWYQMVDTLEVLFSCPQLDLRGVDVVDNAISGDITLVSKGRKVAGLDQTALQPRTEMGVNQNGRWLYLFVVEGRETSEGVTFDELADMLVTHGVYTGIAFDGGGSSTMAIEGVDGRPRVLNTLIDEGVPGRERAVGNHLGIAFKK